LFPRRDQTSASASVSRSILGRDMLPEAEENVRLDDVRSDLGLLKIGSAFASSKCQKLEADPGGSRDGRAGEEASSKSEPNLEKQSMEPQVDKENLRKSRWSPLKVKS
jgi:hypothetical protein